jgi:hypothetical protein
MWLQLRLHLHVLVQNYLVKLIWGLQRQIESLVALGVQIARTRFWKQTTCSLGDHLASISSWSQRSVWQNIKVRF